MMDLVTALGLAGNLVQFVTFGTDLVKAADELQHSPNTAENTDLLNITPNLKRISEKIANSLEKVPDEHQLGQEDKVRYLLQFVQSATHYPNRNSEVSPKDAPNLRNRC